MMTSLNADNLTDIQRKAADGDAKAQLDLAICLRDGKDITKNDTEAMQWAHKAADAGLPDAVDFVGFAYLRGAVVKRNPQIAIAYFKASTELAPAAFNLGQCYYGAQGTGAGLRKGTRMVEEGRRARTRTCRSQCRDGLSLRRRHSR